jgi:cytochrome c553
MKLKLFVILVVTLGYLTVTFYSNKASSLPRPIALINSVAPPDGINPPHAVDTAGKAIPESSATQPDKPIILSKDSTDPKWGELKPEAAFDHTKHTTDLKHTLDGKTLNACTVCHHTEQPSAPPAEPYLKTFKRTEVLTAKQLETSKVPVKSCRACHFQEATEETAEFPPKGVTYPKEMSRQPTGKLTNDNAYHTNCILCHEAAVKRDPTLKPPLHCGDCHIKKA